MIFFTCFFARLRLYTFFGTSTFGGFFGSGNRFVGFLAMTTVKG